MTDVTTTDLTIDTTATPAIDPAEFAALGEGHIAYVRPIRSDEVRSLFPQAPEMGPGLDLFAQPSSFATRTLRTSLARSRR